MHSQAKPNSKKTLSAVSRRGLWAATKVEGKGEVGAKGLLCGCGPGHDYGDTSRPHLSKLVTVKL